MASFDIRIAADQRHAQTPSPRLQHSVRLLQMSSIEFAAVVREAMGQNPFLEADELDPSDDTIAGDDLSEGQALEPHEEASVDMLVDASPDEASDAWTGADGVGSTYTDDLGLSRLEAIADEVSLARHLHDQLKLMPLQPRDLMLAMAVVESIDDDGYLRSPLNELIDVLAVEPPACEAELALALRRVQALDPAGVGARDIGECLLLQLPAIECPAQRELVRTIITEHLTLLARRDLGGLARRVGANLSDIEAACDRIRRLDPRPGWRFGSSQIAYVVPDVIASKLRGKWQVQLNPAVVPRLRLNQSYADLFQRHRGKNHHEMAGLLQDAQWTLRNLNQRCATVLEVAAAIVRRQRNFLEYGPMAMKPLGLREIATELGIHESTVSRVTNNKFIATPNGVFELKFFFSRVMRSANGSACSGTAIRGLIGEMIAAEQPGAPLSDAEITRQLGAQGLVVARRTVTKYRQLLRIDPIERRRFSS